MPKRCAASRPPARSCLAKTNTPEFAAGANTNNALFGPTRNPWNPALSPAGSSGGSAVAVAAGMVPIAQGTDLAARSASRPRSAASSASAPTPGLTPSYPLHLPWDPGQVHGPLARDAEDAALLLDCARRLQPHLADLGGAAVGKRAGRA